MNWRSTNRTPDARVTAFNRSGTMNQRGLGGGGDFIKSLSPIFYIKDLTQVVDGYFVDSSGNNKQIQVATTTVANDSLIMPANDSAIISALTDAGCYSQFYTNDSTPKTVLLSNVSPCYNNYAYYGYIEKRDFFVCSTSQAAKRDRILDYLKIDICTFDSIQGESAVNISIVFRCYSNKLAYVDYGNWGNQNILKVNATDTNHTLASTGYQANKTYKCQLFSVKDDNGFASLSIASQTTICNFNLSSLPYSLYNLYISIIGVGSVGELSTKLARNLLTVELSGIAGSFTINTDFFVNATFIRLLSGNIICNLNNIKKDKVTHLALNSQSQSVIITGSITGFGTNLLYLQLYGSAGSMVTGNIEDLPPSLNSTIGFRSIGNAIRYNNGILYPWSSCNINVWTALTTAMVDSFLINYASVAGAGIKAIDLAGNNQPRTASDPNVIAAITTLQGLGKTVTTN